MNKLKATALSQRHHEGLGSIEALCGGKIFRLLVFENQPNRNDGDTIYLIIKESEIAVSISEPHDISISNRIESTIVSLKKGEILCEIELLFEGQKLTSIITIESAARLRLQVGGTVYALIKANEIYLEDV